MRLRKFQNARSIAVWAFQVWAIPGDSLATKTRRSRHLAIQMYYWGSMMIPYVCAFTQEEGLNNEA